MLHPASVCETGQVNMGLLTSVIPAAQWAFLFFHSPTDFHPGSVSEPVKGMALSGKCRRSELVLPQVLCCHPYLPRLPAFLPVAREHFSHSHSVALALKAMVPGPEGTVVLSSVA